MVQQSEQFNQRLTHVRKRHRRSSGGMGYIVHPDGVVTPIGRSSRRLRFPIKGLVVSFGLAVAVKAYVMWFLGPDVYSLSVQAAVEGAGYEDFALSVLMPDALSGWLAEKYEAFYVFVQEGMANGAFF